MTNQTQSQSPRSQGHWSLAIGHSLGIGNWSLVILLLLAAPRMVEAQETNQSPATATVVDTNAPAAVAPETNAAPVRPLDTNSVTLTAIDTNSPGFSNPETNPPSTRKPPPGVRYNLDSFSILWERNIFNPSRRPFRRGAPRIEREFSRPSSESFALIGTMSYDKGDFAFFGGSSSEFRKVLKPDDTIAGYKVAEIAPNYVKLSGTNGQTLELPIGMEMRKRDEEWRLAERPGPTENPASPDATSISNAPGASAEQTEPTSNSPENDVLKRLLQKREQELNK